MRWIGILEATGTDKHAERSRLMFGNEMMENDAVKQDLERRYKKAADSWRFRGVQTKGGRAWVAILTALVAFFVR
jgi:hypothetical protein